MEFLFRKGAMWFWTPVEPQYVNLYPTNNSNKLLIIYWRYGIIVLYHMHILEICFFVFLPEVSGLSCYVPCSGYVMTKFDSDMSLGPVFKKDNTRPHNICQHMYYTRIISLAPLSPPLDISVIVAHSHLNPFHICNDYLM